MGDVVVTVYYPLDLPNSSCCSCCLNIIEVKRSYNQTYNRFLFEDADSNVETKIILSDTIL